MFSGNDDLETCLIFLHLTTQSNIYGSFRYNNSRLEWVLPCPIPISSNVEVNQNSIDDLNTGSSDGDADGLLPSNRIQQMNTSIAIHNNSPREQESNDHFTAVNEDSANEEFKEALSELNNNNQPINDNHHSSMNICIFNFRHIDHRRRIGNHNDLRLIIDWSNRLTELTNQTNQLIRYNGNRMHPIENLENNNAIGNIEQIDNHASDFYTIVDYHQLKVNEHHLEENDQPSVDEGEVNCGICLDTFPKVDDNNLNYQEEGNAIVQIKKCHHMFHHSCLSEWMIRSRTCPYCRANI